MKRPLLLTLLFVLLALFAVLFLQNGDSIEIEFLIWRFQFTIALLALSTFFLGFLIALLITLPLWLTKRNDAIKLQTQLLNVLREHAEKQALHSGETPPSDAELQAKYLK
jgi:uncharacterized integral membrane protein